MYRPLFILLLRFTIIWAAREWSIGVRVSYTLPRKWWSIRCYCRWSYLFVFWKSITFCDTRWFELCITWLSECLACLEIVQSSTWIRETVVWLENPIAVLMCFAILSTAIWWLCHKFVKQLTDTFHCCPLMAFYANINVSFRHEG